MKNQDVLFFVLIAVFGFLIWSRSSNESFVDVSANKSVEPSTIQSIINSVQKKVPDVYPLETIYINPFQGTQGSQVYNARILFLNTRGYFGVQYDIQADANGNIISMSEQPSPYVTGPFMAYTPDGYEKFQDIQTVLDKQFSDLKSNTSWYESKLDTFMETQRLYQRQAALEAARSPYEKLSETTQKQGFLGPGALALSD